MLGRLELLYSEQRANGHGEEERSREVTRRFKGVCTFVLVRAAKSHLLPPRLDLESELERLRAENKVLAEDIQLSREEGRRAIAELG